MCSLLAKCRPLGGAASYSSALNRRLDSDILKYTHDRTTAPLADSKTLNTLALQGKGG
jgi:hypothetical protein